eukprot:TRINITY_DN65653_c0_g1_i2.p3 TRINITY_DN65653_c0_g1~~TRINITY_DN65653_c0_g1_i2.p3  ORF type:complete len:167 (+),score=20.65 TRINITY_DN65653_c0_g1_i2:52-552(+)
MFAWCLSQQQYVDGKSLADFGVEDLSVIELALSVDGGRKKKKKKSYTKPKKIKHKPKKVKLAVLKYYKVDPRTHKIERLKRECTHPDCGPGVFMANHFDRQYCGKCHLTYMGINKDGKEQIYQWFYPSNFFKIKKKKKKKNKKKKKKKTQKININTTNNTIYLHIF